MQQNRTFHFHGYVHNTGKVALAQPDISVQLFAADGSLLGIVRCFGDRYVLPGEKIPFRGIQLNVPANYARHTVDYTPVAEQYFTFLTDFRPDQVVFREAPGVITQFQLSGYVFNNTKESVKLLKIIIMLYDAQGVYVGSAYGFAARKSIPAGESSPFQVNIMTYNLRAKPARYTLAFSALRDVQ